jgi:hypothetical protein
MTIPLTLPDIGIPPIHCDLDDIRAAWRDACRDLREAHAAWRIAGAESSADAYAVVVASADREAAAAEVLRDHTLARRCAG